MAKQNDLGNIAHEHIEFYSLKSLKYLFENNGLEIFRIEENFINGGSYRIYCRKFNKGSIKLKKENTLESIMSFVKRVKRNKKETVKFIDKELKKNKKIFLYGASTKGNTVLQYYNLTSKKIPFAAERSPPKWGRYTVGTGIKIISEKKSKIIESRLFSCYTMGFYKRICKKRIKMVEKRRSLYFALSKMKIIKRK